MKNKRKKIPISANNVWDSQVSWSKKAIVQIFDLDDLGEHPKIKFCNLCLSDANFIFPKTVIE